MVGVWIKKFIKSCTRQRHTCHVATFKTRGYKAFTGVGPLLGSLRSNDTDGNENVKKNNWFNKQNNNSAHASCFVVNFFPVFARL